MNEKQLVKFERMLERQYDISGPFGVTHLLSEVRKYCDARNLDFDRLDKNGYNAYINSTIGKK